MRKLPPDSEVYNLRQSGVTAAKIAETYGVRVIGVYNAIRRHKALPVHGDKHKAVNQPHAFNHVGRDPIDHRDTGEGFGFGEIQSAYRPQHLSVDECSDLLRECGAK